MVLLERRQALRLTELQTPTPGVGQVFLMVSACEVYRTGLRIVDGKLPKPKLSLVPGHEMAGRLGGLGEAVTRTGPDGGGQDPFVRCERGIGWLLPHDLACLEESKSLCAEFHGNCGFAQAVGTRQGARAADSMGVSRDTV